MLIFCSDLEVKLSAVDGLVPEDWKKAPQLSKWAGKRIQGTTTLTFLPGKVMEWLILEAISSHMDDKKVLRSTSLLPHYYQFNTSLKVNHA